MNHESQIDALADDVRSSGILGRPGTLPRLFEYLLEQSRDGRRLKELEIALAVFNKDERFDVSTDSLVRVYVHKLRRKLEDHFSRSPERARLVVPKGEYRLVVEAPAAAIAPPPARKPLLRAAALPARLLQAVLMVSLIANLAFLANRWIQGAYASQPNHAHPLWSRLLNDDLPIYVVVGDYYIFGEAGDDMNIRRLVREFDINSPADLREYLYRHPDLSSRYQNLGLSYLPTATAFALRELMPVLATSGKQIEIVQASEVTAHILKSAHVVYIGYLSGLRTLQDLTFKHSRFSFGESYDELIDRVAQRNYVSQAGVPIEGEMVYFDYGYVSAMLGPNGNQIVTVAGLRDAGVMHSAELLANAAKLRELGQAAMDDKGFEALYEVSAID
ncbi:MAG: helix-turn-helix domain-containing protein, partial [Pseudomonadota bacterium]|nr:helix-turn-helix domain-containing protein [Pseudomonadota bacterium]